MGLKLGREDAESGIASYTYDKYGNILTKTDARSITTTIAYDALNRPTAKSYNDNPQTPIVNYFYDSQTLPSGAPTFDRGYATGRLVAVTYGGGSAGNYNGFDALGRTVRKIQRTDSVNYLSEAIYNVSAMTGETYANVPGFSDRRGIDYTFDSAGRLTSAKSNNTSYATGAQVSGITYAAHGALASETYDNNRVHAITYNNRLQANEIKLGTTSSPTSILDLTYNFGTTNNNGNLQSMSYSGGGLSYTQTFGYDTLNRLTTSQENTGASWSQTNGYDRYGNRWIDLGGGNQSLYFTASTNHITGWGYDDAGNLLNDGVHAYTYDAENRIRTVDGAAAYVYDGDGQRVRKLVGENTRFVYGIGGQLIMEFAGSSGSLTKEYVYGGGSMATIAPNGKGSVGVQYLTSDYLGTPRVITKADGSVAARHDYKPLGEEIFAGTGGRNTGMGFSASDGIRKKFTGYERDTETGLDFAQARYYSNTQARFTSADPLMDSASVGDPQSWNRYAYVGNNPLTTTDPTGMIASHESGAQYYRQHDAGVYGNVEFSSYHDETWVAMQEDALAEEIAQQQAPAQKPKYPPVTPSEINLVVFEGEPFQRDQVDVVNAIVDISNRQGCSDAFKKENLTIPYDVVKSGKLRVAGMFALKQPNADALLGWSAEQVNDAKAQFRKQTRFLWWKEYTAEGVVVGTPTAVFNSTALRMPMFGGLKAAVIHAFIHIGGRPGDPKSSPHDLANWPGYDRIMKACQ